MMYQSLITKHPELESRIDAYVHFYRYSIPNSLLERLLDKNIKVVTHNNSNRQWDPNYSYKLVQELIKEKGKPEFEIQYNVGSVFKSVDQKNILRVGEIGGMAGVTKVEDAYFTGLSRGGIGFGIPSVKLDEDDLDIKEFTSGVYSAIKGEVIGSKSTQDLIKENFTLMLVRENSQVINQRPFYDNADTGSTQGYTNDGINLSVGKRVLAQIIKSMIIQDNISEPIIIATGKMDTLKKQAAEIGMELMDKGIVMDNYRLFEVNVNGRKGHIVQGFFNNKFVNTVMQHSSIPVVFSGEGSMNEGLSFKSKGFMIPFYDYQITTLIEASGIKSKQQLEESQFLLDDSYFESNKKVFMQMNNPALQSIKEHDLLKLKVDDEAPQLYFAIKESETKLTLKKLDKTEINFELSQTPSLQESGQRASGTIYKLEDWAKEWLKVIYARNIGDIDLAKLGQQSTTLLEHRQNAVSSWFDLFDKV